MNNYTFFAILSGFILCSSSSFAQEIKKTKHPNITITVEEGKDNQRIYHLPSHCTYTVMRDYDRMKLLEGDGEIVDITGLVPGVYFVDYIDDSGNRMIDRFTVDDL